jgi:hypothetical protein
MSKIITPAETKSKIKNFFSFENNIIIICVIFLGAIFSIPLLEGNQSQIAKEPLIAPYTTNSLFALYSDTSHKISNSLTAILEGQSFIYFALGTFSLLFFLVVDQFIISHIRKARKKSHSFK